MAQSPDHPELRFVQASGYTRGRPDGPPLFLVAHTMEAAESSTQAENTAAYFASGAGGRSVSSHYCVDDNSIIQCVRLGDVAWTVGNRPGNNRGINWEFTGFARQTAPQWGDAFSMAMLARAAPYWAADAKRFGIPIERRTVDELKAFKPGLTTHNDLRLAFGGTTHTDPGPNFPWSSFISMIRGAGMPEYSEAQMKAFPWQYSGGGIPTGMSTLNVLNTILLRTDNIQTRLAAIEARLDEIGAGDPAHTHTVTGTAGAVQP